MKRSSFSVFQCLGVVLLGFTVALSAAGASTPFFETDVWADPARPFLFYGEGKVPKAPLKEKESTPKPPSIAGLKARVQERLEAAIMDPTDENIASYLQVNALLFEKAGRFAERWRDVLIRYPEYDWTTGRPVVNSASTTLSRERDAERSAKLTTLAGTWGLVFFGDAGRLTGLMRPLVDRFAGMTGMELIQVAVGGGPRPIYRVRTPIPASVAEPQVALKNSRLLFSCTKTIRILPTQDLLPRALLILPNSGGASCGLSKRMRSKSPSP